MQRGRFQRIGLERFGRERIGLVVSRTMRRLNATRTIVALVSLALAVCAIGTATAGAALSKARAEHAVVQRVKAKYFPPSGAFAECHRLNSTRLGCTYSYKSYSQSWCEGGAKVRQFPSGLAVSLSKPRAVIDNGGC